MLNAQTVCNHSLKNSNLRRGKIGDILNSSFSQRLVKMENRCFCPEAVLPVEGPGIGCEYLLFARQEQPAA